MSKIKLLLALGNPGPEFENTYHNAARILISQIAKLLKADFKAMPALLADLAQAEINGNKVVLAKSLTFMNASGQAAAKLKKALKLKNQEILVMRDDSDMALGKLRVISRSHAGGHKGLESVIKTLGRNDFWQMKIGIRSKKYPVQKIKAGDLVLKKMTWKEKEILFKAAKEILKFLEFFISQPQKITLNL